MLHADDVCRCKPLLTCFKLLATTTVTIQAQLRDEEAKRLESHAAWEARQAEEEETAKVAKLLLSDFFDGSSIEPHLSTNSAKPFYQRIKTDVHRLNVFFAVLKELSVCVYSTSVLRTAQEERRLELEVIESLKRQLEEGKIRAHQASLGRVFQAQAPEGRGPACRRYRE